MIRESLPPPHKSNFGGLLLAVLLTAALVWFMREARAADGIESMVAPSLHTRVMLLEMRVDDLESQLRKIRNAR